MQATSVENLGVPSEDQHSAHALDLDPGVHSPMSPAVQKTMRKAQKQTDKATPPEKGRSGSEEEKPDRTLRTEESRGPALLPVVSEAGENGEQGDTKLASSPMNEKADYDTELSFSPPRMNSIPGLRKVSPSTVCTATDMADDTSVSSPQAMDFEPGVQTDAESQPEYAEDRWYTKPPRIASDLILPQSPLGESVMKSINDHLSARSREDASNPTR